MEKDFQKIKVCRICGSVDEGYFPWGIDGKSPTYDICDCCNVEFGYEDSHLVSIRYFRQHWMKSEKFLSDLKYQKRLENIPQEFF